MKKLLYSICIGSLALSLTTQAADKDNEKNSRRKGKAAVSQSSGQTKVQPSARVGRRSFNKSGQVQTQRNLNAGRFRQHHNAVTTQSNVNANSRRQLTRTNRINRFQASQQTNVRSGKRLTRHNNATFNAQTNVRSGNRLTRHPKATVNAQTNVRGDRNRNFNANGKFGANHDRNLRVNRTHNVVVNNWHGQRFGGHQYSAFRNYNRQWHHRNWWRGHHSRIVFVFGGAYYWNSGYWYPAWGYDPGYSYVYDGPIYGYNNLSPDQVVINVQARLQADGYYDGAVDGLLGPETRQAIADYQADNGLAVTAAVDEPTLETLGLV